jgi:hypothetical protein
MAEWLMYASVEMLLKFCAEKFSSECTARQPREKSSAAHTFNFCKVENSHWLSRYFTHWVPPDRIQFALVDSSTDKF